MEYLILILVGTNPRSYEVVVAINWSSLITVDKLQDLQKKLKDLKELLKRINAEYKCVVLYQQSNYKKC